MSPKPPVNKHPPTPPDSVTPVGTPDTFVNFFRKYVNGWIAAAVVLPTAITWKAMPVYESQRSILSTYTALICVLTLAFLFYSRGLFLATAELRSRIGVIGLALLPLLLIGGAVFCGCQYYADLIYSARLAQMPLEDSMKSVSLGDIPRGGALLTYYILSVVFAEAALFFMAFREWIPSKKQPKKQRPVE